MGSTLSTAHRLEIRRALYLTPSNNKYFAVIWGFLLGNLGKLGNLRRVLCSTVGLIPNLPKLLKLPKLSKLYQGI